MAGPGKPGKPRDLAATCAAIARAIAAGAVRDDDIVDGSGLERDHGERGNVLSCLHLFAAEARPRRVLAVGTHDGRRPLALLTGAVQTLEELVAVELDPRHLDFVRERIEAKVRRLGAAPRLDYRHALPAHEDAFDLIVLGSEHVRLAPELCPRLRDGGVIVLDDVSDDVPRRMRALLPDLEEVHFWDFPFSEGQARPCAVMRKGRALVAPPVPRPAGRTLAPAEPGDGPRVSFVVGTRNDDHGGNPLRRMELFVHGLAALARRHRLAAELIVVEWNPPPDRPPLARALAWPAEPGPLGIRVVTVPPALHARVENSDKLAFFQMISKNVGIRRARGAFVVATNMDLLFSEALVWFLAHGPLDPDAVYRMNRLDVRLRDLPPGLDIEEQLALCSLNVARVCEVRGTIARPALELRARFGHAAGPWPGFRPGELEELLASGRRARPVFEACGDFTMLARAAWERLCGYPELGMYSLHFDSILLKTAMVAGLEQVVLPDPMRMYHIEHGMGWGVSQDRTRLMRDYPMLSDAQLAAWLGRLEESGTPLTPNGDDWGLANEDLAEWRWEPAS